MPLCNANNTIANYPVHPTYDSITHTRYPQPRFVPLRFGYSL